MSQLTYKRYSHCKRVFHILMAPGRAWCPVCGVNLEDNDDA